MKPKLPRALLKRIRQIKAKRPRTVLTHILKHGFITTELLKEKYGYNHPPRAARDVREHGIALETFAVKSSGGRKIAAYRFNVKATLRQRSGRKAIPKSLKTSLILKYGSACSVCGGKFDPTFLQIDHRVPFEVGGYADLDHSDAFMLVCASCNRRKSWACESCTNWLDLKEAAICQRCSWASPEHYDHIALVAIRRVDVVWQDEEVAEFEKLRESLEKRGITVQQAIKRAIRDSLEK